MIKCFSDRQRLQCLNCLEYALARAAMDHLISYAYSLSFKASLGNLLVASYIHTYTIFRCSPRGFSATCLQQMQGSVVEGLSQTATSGSQCFFLSETLSCALS